MAAFDPDARVRRLEQQLEAFERLHGDELRELQRRLEAYQGLHEDEVRLLREELADLRAALAAEGESPARIGTHGLASTAQAVEEAVDSSLHHAVSRRELFGGHRPEGDQ